MRCTVTTAFNAWYQAAQDAPISSLSFGQSGCEKGTTSTCGNGHMRHTRRSHRLDHRACLPGSAGLVARAYRQLQRRPGHPAYSSGLAASSWLAPALLACVLLLSCEVIFPDAWRKHRPRLDPSLLFQPLQVVDVWIADQMGIQHQESRRAWS